MPKIGKLSKLLKPELSDVRQYPIKGFKTCLIFYRATDTGVEIIRVLHGARDLEPILDEDLQE